MHYINGIITSSVNIKRPSQHNLSKSQMLEILLKILKKKVELGDILLIECNSCMRASIMLTVKTIRQSDYLYSLYCQHWDHSETKEICKSRNWPIECQEKLLCNVFGIIGWPVSTFCKCLL